jgi:hypothetical protein
MHIAAAGVVPVTNVRCANETRQEDFMKRLLLLVAAVLASALLLAGCALLEGGEGSSYVSLTYNASADGLLCNMAGFPSSFYTGTYYAIAEGVYAGDYVLYDNYYTSGVGYCTSFNSSYPYYLYNASSYADNVSAYNASVYASYHNDISYTITNNDGELFFLDGADKYYDIYLAWYPSASAISSNKVPMKEVVIEDSTERVIKEFSDGVNTIRLEIKKNEAPAALTSRAAR